MGQGALDVLGDDGEFVPCVHSDRCTARARPGRRAVAVQPPTTSTSSTSPRPARSGSYGSGYGGNALLAQEVLRPADRVGDGPRRRLARRAHAHPQADRHPRASRSTWPPLFPSACGKTNLAMLVPTLPGWKAETIGDDICWMKFGDDGRLYAINPEAGFFGVAPGTSHESSNRNAMATLEHGQRDLHQYGAHRRRRCVVGRHRRSGHPTT